jgi:hypothetical protein
MNTKSLQTKILENWYGIDAILFGRNKAEKILESDDYKRFITSKASLLSNLYEIYKHIGYEPSLKINSIKKLKESSLKEASKSRNRAAELIKDKTIMEGILEDIKEICLNEGLNKEQVSNYVTAKSFKSLSIDALVLENALQEGCTACLKEFHGKVLVDTHETLRDVLIDLVM